MITVVDYKVRLKSWSQNCTAVLRKCNLQATATLRINKLIVYLIVSTSVLVRVYQVSIGEIFSRGSYYYIICVGLGTWGCRVDGCFGKKAEGSS